MNQAQQSGSKAYLFSIVLVAVLGGLLFGYETQQFQVQKRVCWPPCL